MAEQPKSGIASLADRAKNMFRRVVEYPDPSVVMADQATADIPEAFKDPRTYIEAEKGAVAGTLGLLGDVGSMSEGVADYIPYMPTFLRAPVQTLRQLPTTEDVKEFGIEKGLLTREETEGVPFQVGEFLSPVPAGAVAGVLPVISRNIAKAKELLKEVKLPKKIKPNYVYSQEQIDAAELQKKKYINIDGDYPIIGGQAPILDKLTDKPFQYSPENLSNDFGAVHTVVLDVDEALRFFPDRQLNATKTISYPFKSRST